MNRPIESTGFRLGLRFTAMATLAALACALPFSAARAQALTRIVVGGQITDDTTPILYALKAGLFKRAGLDVQLRKTTNGGTAVPALLGGTFDIADTNVLSVANAHIKDVPLEVVAPGIIYDGTTNFVATIVKTDSPLGSGADLKGTDLNGKVIGTSTIGDLNAIAISDWMDQHGGNSKTIKQVELAWSNIAPAIEAGRVDVGTLVQPFLSQALATGKVRTFVKASDAIGTRYLITGWIATAGWDKTHADAARSFARVVRDAQQYCNAHAAETAPLLAEYSGAELDQVEHGGRATYAAQFADPKDIQPVVNVAYKYGAISKAVNAKELISPAIAGLIVGG